MNLPERKQTRLQNYDYSQNGAYFITICTHNKVSLFGKIKDDGTENAPTCVVGAIHESPECKLSAYGKILKLVLQEIPERYNVKISDYVIMPNHLHLLIWLENDNNNFCNSKRYERAIRESPLQNNRSVISKIVGYLKMNVLKQAHNINKNVVVWQRNYYDHVVRNFDEYLKIAKYIQENPLKWELECYYNN